MTLGSHQRPVGVSQVHITPRRIIDPLGVFDLDPCGNDPRPWDCAKATYTEADWFQEVWNGATALLFLRHRVIFHRPDGSLCTTPVILAAYGWEDADILAYCGIAGQFVPLRIPRAVLIEALEPTWHGVVGGWLREQRGPVSVDALYRAFSQHPKARRNPNYRAKLRQTLQRGAGRRIGPNQWVAA